MKLFDTTRHRHTNTLKILKNKTVHSCVLFFIFGSIGCIIASSFELANVQYTLLLLFLWISTFIFTLEYLLRLISAPALYVNMSNMRARLRYMFSFYGLVDFVAIIPFLLLYLHWDTNEVHIIMLPYIFIIFKLIRYSPSFRLIGKVFYQAKDELITAYTACGILVCFSAIIMYYIERGAQPEAFNNIGSGLWWAVISFTTVGYGDIYPITSLGRILNGFINLIGIGMIALPTGIISSSFIRIVQEKKELALKKREQALEKVRSENEVVSARRGEGNSIKSGVRSEVKGGVKGEVKGGVKGGVKSGVKSGVKEGAKKDKK